MRNIREHHHFFWQSELTTERMDAISQWIGKLPPEERSMLNDLLKDAVDRAENSMIEDMQVNAE